MGFEYITFRTIYEFKRKTGILKKKFPAQFIKQKFISLAEWRENSPEFFFESKEKLTFKKNPDPELKFEYEKYLNGELKFFNSKYYKIGNDYDWLTNPLTGYKYQIDKHWTEIEDLEKEAGDIKYVWEKSRFSFLYMLIRYDYHFGVDNSEYIFNEIISWIKSNPLNMGPNYKCSQEISLRILNWTFALYYYKNSAMLTEDIFQTIINSIYWQLKHVYENINFSRKSVRNNHAITETLMLFLSGLLFPFFPESLNWNAKGKRWFEKEINYQIYEDGSHLQFSMNYHRVVIQLLTWAIVLAKKNNVKLDNSVFIRAEKSVYFLVNHLNPKDGFLPNYGANDGALFFKLNNSHYRDYRPQINALQYFLFQTVSFNDEQNSMLEDIFWYGGNNFKIQNLQSKGIKSFRTGGYYSFRDESSFTFVRCGNHKDRPSQADNLHLDIWVEGKNILRDAGSYLYNTDSETIRFFNGTKSHNTVMLGNNDQMLKGGRFIWYYWSQAISSKISEDERAIIFFGSIKAFQYIDKNIIHSRQIKKYKKKMEWEIIDIIEHTTDLPITQIWNIDDTFEKQFSLTAIDEDGEDLEKIYSKGWYSSFYGIKKESKQILFSTPSKKIITTLKRKKN